MNKVKRYIYGQAGYSMMQCAQDIIRDGDIPCVRADWLIYSRTLKKVDKYLREMGFIRKLVKEFRYKTSLGYFVTEPEHFEYIKKGDNNEQD